MLIICFILFLLISILTQSYAQVCASGWVKGEGGDKCYLFQRSFQKWPECYGYCNSLSYPGAMMLCVLTQTENAWMYKKYKDLKQQGDNIYGGWIGYSDIKKNVSLPNKDWFGWVPGCSSNYTNWSVGNPNNAANNEHYAHFYLDQSWNDYTAAVDLLCACQYTPPAPSNRPTAAPSTRAPSKGPTPAPSTALPSTYAPTAAPSTCQCCDSCALIGN